MPPVVTFAEYLSFDAYSTYPAVPMNTPAWDVLDYSPFYDDPPMIGDDRPIPGSPGRLGIAREYDELDVALRMVIYGDADLEGTPYADPRVGVRANAEYLRANLLRAFPANADGTRPVTFHRLDGGTAVGDVIPVAPLSLAPAGPTLLRAVLRLVIPAGFVA